LNRKGWLALASSPPPAATDSPEFQLTFKYQASQKRLFRYVSRGGGMYLELKAPQCLEVGGQRSGKTTGKLVYGIENYCLRYRHCDMLALRRTISELKSGVIEDFFKFFPKDSGWYTYNLTDRIATFKNGSRLVFGGCENNLEKDIEKYLGQSFPYILLDECSQFSQYAWDLLGMRNLVNVQCEPDDHGNLPTPYIVGCTNPTGPYWTYYHTIFVKQEPWERTEGMRRAKDGRWFREVAGQLVEEYNPANYAYNHSTVLDNPEYLRRDPGIIKRLQSKPEALRKKFLQGYMDTVEGPYFDCWNEEYHVLDLRTSPYDIRWQDYQPVWGGQDFGVGHWNAAYFFTKALVKVTKPDGSENWVSKTVCFAEIAPESTGHTNVELADMLNAKAYYPRLPDDHPDHDRISGRRVKLSTLYFSHEKFSRVMEKHSPADEYSRLLRERDLPSVSRATMDRIGSAAFMYNELKLGRLVILRTCPGIIMAIPSLQRNKDRLDDVLKVDNKADDRYDAFRYGLYGGLAVRRQPTWEKEKEYADTLSPMARHFHLRKAALKARDSGKSFVQESEPIWMSKLQ
jgi:hypothetical protein